MLHYATEAKKYKENRALISLCMFPWRDNTGGLPVTKTLVKQVYLYFRINIKAYNSDKQGRPVCIIRLSFAYGDISVISFAVIYRL